MNHPQWWLIVVAFVLGMVLTFALTIRRVRREVPVGHSTPRTCAHDVSDPAVETTPDIPVVEHSPRRSVIRRWPWWASAAVLSAVAVAIAATLTLKSHDRGSSTSSSAPTSTAPPAVAVPALASLLLPAEQIAEIVGATKMSKSSGFPALVPDSTQEIAEADCVSAWNAGRHSVYAGTGETGAYSEAWIPR